MTYEAQISLDILARQGLHEISLTIMLCSYQRGIMGGKAICCGKAQWPHESSQYGQGESS